MNSVRAILLALVAALALAGCAGAPRAQTAPPPPDPRGVTILRGEDGSPVTWSRFCAEAALSDVVMIGETHGHPLGLAAAAALWEDLLAITGDPALSLEFFERDTQAGLDDYLLGITDRDAFEKATGRGPGNYPEGHRAMVEAARIASVPVVAANAPRRYVRIARREGYERLRRFTDEQRRLFRIPDEVPQTRYRDDFMSLMTGGGAAAHGSADAAERERAAAEMFRSQVLWDWTMAESIARALEHRSRPVVHVVGRFHSDFRGESVRALELLRPGVRVLTLSFVAAETDSLREEDRGRADFVVYVGP